MQDYEIGKYRDQDKDKFVLDPRIYEIGNFVLISYILLHKN